MAKKGQHGKSQDDVSCRLMSPMGIFFHLASVNEVFQCLGYRPHLFRGYGCGACLGDSEPIGKGIGIARPIRQGDGQ
jgi:hypothetical protein